MNAVPEKANPQEQSYQPQSEKKSLVILLCTLFLLPIVFSPHNLVAPENVKIFFLSVFVLVSFFFLALAEFKKQRMQFYNHPLFFSALFTFAFLFLSAAFSKFPIASWTTSSGGYPFLVFFTLFTVLIASAYLSNTPSRSLYAVQIIVVSFLLTCIVTILQFFAYDFERFAFTPSFFGTWDDLAVFSGLVVLLSVSIFNFSTSLLARFLLLISFIFASLILFLTHQIPVLVILLVLLFLNLIMKKNSFPSTIALFLIALSLLAATVSISPLNLNRLSVSERLSEITNLPVARETFKEGPIRGLLGSGPNTALYQRDLYSFKTKPLQSWNTDFLTTWGLLPVFSFLIFLFLLFYSGTRVIFEKFSGTETKQNKIVITFFLPIAYLWILAFFYPMNITLLALTFFLTGISIAIYAYTKKGITFFFFF
ncbi:hypothetical protein HYW58_02210 [Candidatus Kaiserbacteria bacterium]|nr:hypothetical protein [Candidatus Kaiserbacteria bacterium]